MRLEGFSFLLFGGKGGSGKTTSACACALRLAREKPERKVMIVSTDPAHSLADSLDMPVGSVMTPVGGKHNLWALEIAADEEAERFRNQHDAVMKKITERGTWLDRQDIDGFFSLTLPGLDEVMGVVKIAGLLKEGDFDVIIVDTAPSGHTMKLLAMPAEMEKWISVLELMQSKHRFLMKQFTGMYRQDDADLFLAHMREDMKRVRQWLKNTRETLFIPVVTPEELSVMETGQFLSVLKRHGIPTQYLVVNRVKSSAGSCPCCSAEADAQEQWMEKIHEDFHDFEMCEVPDFPHEIHGSERLKEYGDHLFGEGGPPYAARERPLAVENTKVRHTTPLHVNVSGSLPSFLIFGGKGGVGKTTLAAAAALHLAAEYPERKTLIFSTDPAHSPSETFSVPIGDKVIRIASDLNLFGIEIDAAKLLAEFKLKYRENIDALFSGFGNTELRFDREIIEELMSASPPGLDELMALAEVMELVDEEQYDLYVFDSAATGHLLNFLAMPDIVLDWLKMIFRLQIKYQNALGLNRIADDLLDLSKKVRRVRGLLTDPECCDFIAITIPEMMGIKELKRLRKGIEGLNIPGSSIVVNRVRPDHDCPFCRAKHREEQRLIGELAEEFAPEHGITQVPLFASQVVGMGKLTELGQALCA